MATKRLLDWWRASANRAVSIAGYRKLRTQRGLAFWPKGAQGFDPWEDLAKIHKNKNGRLIALDVGANAGQSVINARATFPWAKVFSFEPDPRVFPTLETVSSRFLGCRAFPFALGATETDSKLICAQSSEGNSFLAVDESLPEEMRGGWTAKVGTLSVPVRRLDMVCSELGLCSVDVLKIDVQGYELSVLEGAGAMLTPASIHSVLLEICLAPIYEHQASAAELFARFAACGYWLAGLYPGGYLPSGQMTWCDALFSSTG